MAQTPGALSRPAARVTLGRTSRLWLVLAANLALVGALVGVGVSAHSLGVLAEGAGYLADAAAIGVSLAAIRLSARPATPVQLNGYPWATRYAARRRRAAVDPEGARRGREPSNGWSPAPMRSTGSLWWS
jgi:hypothetical protein